MPKTIDTEKAENKKFAELGAAIESRDDEWLDEVLSEPIDLDVVLKFSEGNETPLTSAIRHNYENGVRVLCNKMKVSGILTTHLTHETQEHTPLHFSTYVGNPDIVTILLSQGADPNAYSGKKTGDGDTPLMSAIRYLTPYSLIHDGDWGDKDLQEKLKLWFDGKISLPEGELTVKWSGKLNIINLLLDKGADPTAKDKFKVSPWTLVNTFNDKVHFSRDTFGDGTSKPVFLSGDADHAVFKGKMRKLGTDEVAPVTIIYDIREIRKLLTTYKDKNKDTSATSHKVKELSDALRQEAVERKAKVEDLSRELKQTKEDLSRELKQTKEEQKPLIQEYKGKLERTKIIASFLKGTGLQVFFDMFTKRLHGQLSAVGVINTKKIDRAHYTNADKLSDGVGKLSDLPIIGAFVGGAPKLLGAGAQKLSDRSENKRYAHLEKNVPTPQHWAGFCEDIAIGVLKQCQTTVAQLSTLRATKLVDEAVKLTFDLLSKSEITGDVTKFVIDSLVSSDALAKKMKQLCEEQAKDNAKNAPKATGAGAAGAGAGAPTPISIQYSTHKQKAVALGAAVAVGVDDVSSGSKCLVM